MDTARTIKVPTTSIFDFERLILDGEAKYVDKTALLYELAKSKTDSQLFISRPRRFGKSLMLSTLKAMFETPKVVCVFEFKYAKSAKAAIRQIREKGYADAYRADRRPVTLIGINFSAKKRNIDEPLIENLQGIGE